MRANQELFLGAAVSGDVNGSLPPLAATERQPSVEYFDVVRSERDALRRQRDALRAVLASAREERDAALREADVLRARLVGQAPHAKDTEPDELRALRQRLLSSETKTLALSDALKKTCEAIDRLAEALMEEPCD